MQNAGFYGDIIVSKVEKICLMKRSVTASLFYKIREIRNSFMFDFPSEKYRKNVLFFYKKYGIILS